MTCYIHNTQIKAGTVHYVYQRKRFCSEDCQLRYARSLARIKREGYDYQERDFVPTYPSNEPPNSDNPYEEYSH